MRVENQSDPHKIVQEVQSLEQRLGAQVAAAKASDQGLIVEHSWLQKGHPLGESPGDFRFFSLLAGDGFIKGSSFEGGDTLQNLDCMIKLFDQFPNLEFTKDHSELLEKVHQQLKEMSLCGRLMQNNVSEFLKKNELFLPLSWTNRTSGSHAFILHINKEKREVTFYNTGDGVELHSTVEENQVCPIGQKPVYAVRHQTYLTLKNCDAERLSDPVFYKFLQQLRTAPEKDGSIEIDSKYVYEGIKSYLKASEKVWEDYSSDAYQKGQRSGTCSVKAITSFIYHQLRHVAGGVDLYKKLKFYWQSQALITQIKRAECFTKSKSLLVSDVVKNLSRSAEKLHQKGLLETEELRQWEATVLDIENRLQKQTVGAGSYKIPKLIGVQLRKKKASELSVRQSPPVQNEPLTSTKKTQNKQIAFDATNLVNCRNALIFGTISWGAFISRLPIPGQDTYWQELSKEQSIEMMEEVNKLLQLLRTDRPKSITVISSICLLAVLDQLARNCHNELKGFALSPQVLEILDDPKLVVRRADLDEKLYSAYRYLRREGQPIFSNEYGRVKIDKDSIKKSPTLTFFKQFLTDQKREEIGKGEPLVAQLANLIDLEKKHLPLAIHHYMIGVDKFYLCFTGGNRLPFVTQANRFPLEYELYMGSSSTPMLIGDWAYTQAQIEEFLSAKKTQNQIQLMGCNKYNSNQLDEEQFKKQRMVMGDAHDQPNRVMAFYRKNVSLLRKREESDLFLTLFFKRFSLRQQIEREPRFLQELESFIQSVVGHFSEKEDAEGLKQILRIAEEIRLFLDAGNIEHRIPSYEDMRVSPHKVKRVIHGETYYLCSDAEVNSIVMQYPFLKGKEYSYWIAGDTIYVNDLYKIVLVGSPKSALIRLLDGKELQEGAIVPIFQPFEKEMLVWKKEKQFEFHLCKRDLTFVTRNSNGDLYLYCKQYPGYFLVENEASSGIPQSLAHITLANHKGEAFTLVDFEGSLIEFQSNSGVFYGETIEAKLALTMFSLMEMEYVKANKYLQKVVLFDRLSQASVSLFKAMHNRLKKNEHPEAISIMMRLAKMELMNRMKFPLSVSEEEDDFSFGDAKGMLKKVKRYFDVEPNSPECRLNNEEKRQLYNMLQAVLKKTVRKQEHHSVKLFRQAAVAVDEEKNESRYCFNFSGLADKKISADFFLDKGFVQKKDFFYDNSANLYHIAVSGSSEAKQWLSNLIAFNRGRDDYSLSLLIMVYRFPYLSPSIESIRNTKWGGALARGSILPGLFLEGVTYLASKTLKAQVLARKLMSGQWLGQWNRSVKQTKPVNWDIAEIAKIDDEFDAFFQKVLEQSILKVTDTSLVDMPVLPDEHEDPLVQEKLKQENQDLEAFRKERLEPKMIYEIVGKLTPQLNKKLKEVDALLTEQKSVLAASLNLLSNSLDRIQQVGRGRRLTFEDLKRLTLQGDMEKFQLETKLSEEQVKQVMALTARSLTFGSRKHQLTLALNFARKAAAESNPKRQQNFLSHFVKALEIRVSGRPERSEMSKLWFEFSNGYLYRKNQLEKLREIANAEAKEVQAEMPTGFGKTKTVVNSLNYQNADGKTLVFNCWPASLEMTNVTDSLQQVQKSFGRNVSRITFDRASNFTASHLEFLLASLEESRSKKETVNVRPETVRALELHFISALEENRVKSYSEDRKKQIEFFIKILKLIRNESWVTIDEEHVNLSPIDRLIYTMGQPTTLPDRDIEVLENLFILLEEAFPELVENRQNYITEEKYEKSLAKVVQSFSEIFEVSSDHFESFKSYVMGTVDEPPKWVESCDYRAEISLLRGELSLILPAAFKGCVNQDYGLSKLHVSKYEYAVPYEKANTPKETASGPSQFKNAHETLTKTYLTYLHQGLSEKQVIKFLNYLKADIDTRVTEGFSIPDTEAYKLYRSLVPKAPSIMKLKNEDMKRLAVSISHNRKAINFYIRNIVAPQVKIYPQSIASTAQNFRSQFASSLSLSATPQHRFAHGPDTHFIPMRGTSGQVTHLLLTKCADLKTVHKLEGVSSAEHFDSAEKIASANPKISAIIDIGAQYKGISNLEIATKMCKNCDLDQVAGVLFFDEEEEVFKIMDAETGVLTDPSELHLSEEQRKTYYDQSRCFGSDIPQACDAVALILTSKETTKSEMGQAAGRMRQWHANQSVEVAVPGEMERKSIKDLLVYWIENQVQKEKELHPMSQVQQMSNTLRRAVLDEMLSAGSVGYTSRLYKNNRDLFISEELMDPFAIYGHQSNCMDTRQYLQDEKNRFQARAKQLSGISSMVKQKIAVQLDKISEQWNTLPLPATVPSNTNLNVECEVLQETEVELQLKVHQKPYEYLKQRKTFAWYENINLFKEKWDKPRSLYPLVKRQFKRIIGRVPGTVFDEVRTLAFRVQSNAQQAFREEGVRFMGVFAITLPIGSVLTTIGYFGITIASTNPIGMYFVDCAIATLVLIPTFAGLVLLTGSAISLGFLAVTSTQWGISKPSSFFFEWVANRWHTDVYTCSVRDTLRMHLTKQDYAVHKLIHEKLYATHNFFPQSSVAYETKDGAKVDLRMEAPQPPFNGAQKPLFQLLVIQDGKDALKMIAMDQTDSEFFRRKLSEDTGEEGRTRKIAIYDLEQNMIVDQGANRFEEGELEKNPEFHKILASAKFINGEINYSKKELDYIRKQAATIDKALLERFFIGNILPYHPRNRATYPFRPIAKVLSPSK